jgi:hypothetical protein
MTVREFLEPGTVYYYKYIKCAGVFRAENKRCIGQPQHVYSTEITPNYDSEVVVLWLPNNASTDDAVPPEWGEIAP